MKFFMVQELIRYLNLLASRYRPDNVPSHARRLKSSVSSFDEREKFQDVAVPLFVFCVSGKNKEGVYSWRFLVYSLREKPRLEWIGANSTPSSSLSLSQFLCHSRTSSPQFFFLIFSFSSRRVRGGFYFGNKALTLINPASLSLSADGNFNADTTRHCCDACFKAFQRE